MFILFIQFYSFYVFISYITVSNKHICPFIDDPKSLVGKSVLHQCAEDGIIDWFKGKVTSIVKNHKDQLKIKYSIEYEVEEFKNSWEFCLLKDLEKQDLICNHICNLLCNGIQTS